MTSMSYPVLVLWMPARTKAAASAAGSSRGPEPDPGPVRPGEPVQPVAAPPLPVQVVAGQVPAAAEQHEAVRFDVPPGLLAGGRGVGEPDPLGIPAGQRDDGEDLRIHGRVRRPQLPSWPAPSSCPAPAPGAAAGPASPARPWPARAPTTRRCPRPRPARPPAGPGPGRPPPRRRPPAAAAPNPRPAGSRRPRRAAPGSGSRARAAGRCPGAACAARPAAARPARARPVPARLQQGQQPQRPGTGIGHIPSLAELRSGTGRYSS